MAPKGPLQCKSCQRFGHTQRNCGYVPRCVAGGGSHLSGGCVTPREKPQCCGCVGNHTANYRGCVKCKEVRVALAKRAPEQGPKSTKMGHPVLSKAQRAGPSAEQRDLGEGGSPPGLTKFYTLALLIPFSDHHPKHTTKRAATSQRANIIQYKRYSTCVLIRYFQITHSSR